MRVLFVHLSFCSCCLLPPQLVFSAKNKGSRWQQKGMVKKRTITGVAWPIVSCGYVILCCRLCATQQEGKKRHQRRTGEPACIPSMASTHVALSTRAQAHAHLRPRRSTIAAAVVLSRCLLTPTRCQPSQTMLRRLCVKVLEATDSSTCRCSATDVVGLLSWRLAGEVQCQDSCTGSSGSLIGCRRLPLSPGNGLEPQES